VNVSLRTSAALLLASVIASSGFASNFIGLPRNVLWVVLQSCISTKALIGESFPCLVVDPGDRDVPGTAVLRAPGQKTHTVVIPTNNVIGIEDSELQHDAGYTYWRAALSARSFVTAALMGRLRTEDVGMAVNSAGGRSQDQLHIHLDCINMDVKSALQQMGHTIRTHWNEFPLTLAGSRFFAKRITANEASDFNPFSAVKSLPVKNIHSEWISFAVFSASQPGVDAGLYIFAYHAPESHAEKLLDHRCRVVLSSG